ncbi:MAG: helix-turn-helix domain-containing protein [Chloroflexi bacterium]|nr:helix-turn-helix domain-containing protein [Chloroflexota bacterium]
MANEELINIREAAKQCGRNPETVRRWIWSGKLRAEKLGNQLFIKRDDLASYCRETAVAYRAGARADLMDEMRDLRESIRARAGNFDVVADIEKMREERMNQIGKTLKDTTVATRQNKEMLVFLKKATAIRDRIHARTGKVFSAEAMIRELRDEREHELE